ncbi:MAG TPA: hypothetical protein VFE51_05820 [Verrucomicrobiae bacterium]|nr:hypothetical protein [Verrucomicrobiae bacterium]
MKHTQRPILIALVALVLVWLLAWSGYVIARHSKMTAEKVNQYQLGWNPSRSAADRLKFLRGLAERLNALSPDERQKWRLDQDWFRVLTDEEKAYFIDAFLPGEMQTALKMFEHWPKEQQQHEIDQALKELQANAQKPIGEQLQGLNGDKPPLLTPELDKRVRTVGLNTLFSQGSAETKAQLAPLLIEIQRQLESGQLDLNRF